MTTVYIRHPRIGGAPVEVPEKSLPHHLAGGWEQVDPPQPPRRIRRRTRTNRTTADRRPQED